MRSRLAHALVAFTLICAVGGHWAVLQSVAWVGMVVSYSHGSSLAEALEKTFEGKHPCKICKVVQEGKKSEQKQPLLKVETKLDFWLAQVPSLSDAPPAFSPTPVHPEFAALRFESPPTPPPRLA